MRSTAVEARRYQSVDIEKAPGATYTPQALADFVAAKIIENADLSDRTSISILDPAIGDGMLVLALLSALKGRTNASLSVRGFDTDASALDEAARRIGKVHPDVCLTLTPGNFLDFVPAAPRGNNTLSLFYRESEEKFDIIIANPPYVRTQIMGAARAQQLADAFGLTGRVDLYQAFLLGMVQVLAPDGTTGAIVSNRFMTTKGGGTLRAALREHVQLCQVWDFGDTKLFDAAVLPAVLVFRGKAVSSQSAPAFSSIYQTKDAVGSRAENAIAALSCDGVVEIEDGRRFLVRHGTLDGKGDDVWRLANAFGDEWLATVNRHTCSRFGDIGKIRVGVKTCADKVFIRHDWDVAFGENVPELLRPLMTHHAAGRFRSIPPKKARQILYPHRVVQGKRQPIPLDAYPKSRAYLESHREQLVSRTYVIEGGRSWYELWVPQDPDSWSAPKLVFRDISERPTFWIDLEGSVVNGDCYWLSAPEHTELLWLAVAVANSTFAEAFYDHRFNNKLYAGRRRFITQYVEQFPLPDPEQPISREIVERAKAIYDANHSPATIEMEDALNALVWRAFGLSVEEIYR